jgi:hypothetical protein
MANELQDDVLDDGLLAGDLAGNDGSDDLQELLSSGGLSLSPEETEVLMNSDFTGRYRLVHNTQKINKGGTNELLNSQSEREIPLYGVDMDAFD